ncbi:hypothetical protein K7432_007065 [Basidiobolus ranarum]|uniref:Uncharacterized protein n=1 Tax=Basidiobolus ranarum TaxID=34480 RepID=A0ABR2WTZ8_9FUNG
MSSLEHNPLQTMPKECPLCTKNIIRQRLSFDFEFFMCENIHCSFPFGNTEFEEYLIGDRTLPIQTKKLKKRKATSPDSAKSKLLKMKAPKTTLGNSQPSVVFVDDQIDTSINNNYFMADMESLLSTDQSLSVASNCKETPKAAV